MFSRYPLNLSVKPVVISFSLRSSISNLDLSSVSRLIWTALIAFSLAANSASSAALSSVL
jgi:hypothetical protein